MVTFKEKCRVFYIIKGHLNVTKPTIEGCYDSYFQRIWYNEESYLWEKGFEEAYGELGPTKDYQLQMILLRRSSNTE